MKKTTFPSTALPIDGVIDIDMPKALGLTAKVLIHERARKLEFYNQPIDCDIEGQDKNGKKIAVNTVGRWLFGVPGFDGNIRISTENEKVLIHYPKEAPQEVHDLLSKLKETVLREILHSNK